MSQEMYTDTRSPWYEVFSRTAKVDIEPTPSTSPSDDETWATAAVMSAYND